MVKKMEKYEHRTHTVWCIRRWSLENKGICLIKETGNKKKLKEIIQNMRFRVHGKHIFIMLPFFYFYKDNCNIHIGTVNRYLWVIK